MKISWKKAGYSWYIDGNFTWLLKEIVPKPISRTFTVFRVSIFLELSSYLTTNRLNWNRHISLKDQHTLTPRCSSWFKSVVFYWSKPVFTFGINSPILDRNQFKGESKILKVRFFGEYSIIVYF